MSGNNSVGARILAAQARHCEAIAAEVAQARAAGVSATEIAELEAQELAARQRYQELAVDMPGNGSRFGASQPSRGRRPWWRIW